MDSTPKNDGPQEISLLESLDGEWIKLPLEVMRDIGPAAQTLGGILKMTSRETFSAAADIALKARLPRATADTLPPRSRVLSDAKMLDTARGTGEASNLLPMLQPKQKKESKT